MTVLAVVLYLLGSILGASLGFDTQKTGARVLFCTIFWPIVSLVSLAGLIAGYIEYKKGQK